MKKKSLILFFSILILSNFSLVLPYEEIILHEGQSNSLCTSDYEFNHLMDLTGLMGNGAECWEEFVTFPTIPRPAIHGSALTYFTVGPLQRGYMFFDCYPVTGEEMGDDGSMIPTITDCAVSYYVGGIDEGCADVFVGSKEIDTDGDGAMDRIISFPNVVPTSAGSSCGFITEGLGGVDSVCDGRGNCCDTPIYIDADGDGVGHDGVSSSDPDMFWCGDDYAYTGLSLPTGYSYTSGDCADDDPTQTVCSENSYGDSSCGDGIDNDGDGLTDCEESSCEDFICDISSYGTLYCASDGTCSSFSPSSTPSAVLSSLVTATELIDAYGWMILMPESAYADDYYELYESWRHPVTYGVVGDAYELYYYGIMDIYELNDILKEWILS